ncbi:MAG TPA: SGNH/GDSL hydrolase family protein [Bacteroidia bacterium]|nr:SGNH/GDSL hydrolase family protein [Bacteroidia bacterium]
MRRYFLPSVFAATIFSVVVFYANCTPDLSVPRPQPGSCDFSKMVAVGGDFMSGYMDGALSARGQERSVPALLARQLMLAGGGSFLQEKISVSGGLGWNLKPWESWFVNASKLGFKTDCQGVNSLMPVWDSLARANAAAEINSPASGSAQDFSVPFATMAQLFSPSLGNYSVSQNTNPYYHRIASNAGTSTVIGDAVNVNATFFSAWFGMEDIYNYAQQGGAGVSIPSAATFSAYLDSALSRLTQNGAKGVIANIPDFRDFPYYTLVPWNGAALTQSKADSLNDIYQQAGFMNINFASGNNGFVIADANAPNGFRQMHGNEYITLSVPVDSLKCDYLGLLFSVMPDRYVLDSAEVAYLDMNIAAYNSVIAQKAAQYNLALVDMNSYFRSFVSGIKWDGVNYNAEFVTGGFFSLDGYHPNEKGDALIANEFITAINNKFGATVPTLNCFDCNGVLFP